MISDKALYRMDEKWIYQSWYDPTSVFKLIKVTEFKMRHFGVDCIWENLETGLHINHWDNIMRELTKEELRDFQINKIFNNLK